VTGTVGSIARATNRGFTKIASMPTKAALVDTSIRGAVKRQAAMLQFVDGINRFAGEDLGRRLVYQVVATFDGIVHMPFPMVFFLVAQSGGDASLCGTGV